MLIAVCILAMLLAPSMLILLARVLSASPRQAIKEVMALA